MRSYPAIRSITLALLLLAGYCQAQYEAANWYFGERAGLNFNCDPPEVRRSGLYHTRESCSSISDSSGNLLFYTQGDSVYDRDHHMMDNGFGIGNIGWGSSTQGSLIVKRPESDGLYYIFNVPDASYTLSTGFRYSEIDMSLNGGYGAVTSKANLLVDTVTEKLAAIHHANGTDIWVVVHEFRTNGFRAYPITSSGIGTPVISYTGFVYDDLINPQVSTSLTRGYMKFSVDGTRLFVNVASDHHSFVTASEMFHFDDATGEIDFEFAIADSVPTMYYGASFSPSGQYLYVGEWSNGNGLYQYDVSLPDAASVAASRVTIQETSFDLLPALALQLGPDGKLYIATAYEWLSVIHSPDMSGLACDYEPYAIDLWNCTSSQIGLPNFVESYFRNTFIGSACPTDSIQSDFSHSSMHGTICVGDTVQFNDLSTCYPELVERWKWNFDDPGSLANDSSVMQDPMHIFSAPGTYNVQLISGVWPVRLSCKSDTVTLTVHVSNCQVGLTESRNDRDQLNSMQDLMTMITEGRLPPDALITITDNMGRLCLQSSNSNLLTLLQQFAERQMPGTYFCTVRTPSQVRMLKWVLVR